MSTITVDIGHGVSIEPYTCSHGKGGWFIHWPDAPMGGISICDECPGPTWKVEQQDPLTISPSILQHAIPSLNAPEKHGWIRDGKWVPA